MRRTREMALFLRVFYNLMKGRSERKIKTFIHLDSLKRENIRKKEIEDLSVEEEGKKASIEITKEFNLDGRKMRLIQ